MPHLVNYILIAGGGILVLVLLVRARKRLREATAAEREAATLPRETRLPHAQAAEASIIRAIELHREMEARLQNRAALLEHLIADADARIAELRRERQKGGGA